MKGHTRKHRVTSYLGDYRTSLGGMSVDAVIYTSGGTLYTVWVDVLFDNGKCMSRPPQSFQGRDACARAHDYAKQAGERERACADDVGFFIGGRASVPPPGAETKV